MKKKTSVFSGENSLKLFLGIFVSVISMFVLVYVVQNPFYKPASQAASTNTSNTVVTPR